MAALAVAAIGATLIAPAPVTAIPTPAMPSDFNGDGFVDLAVGAPNDCYSNGGDVTIIPGSADGLTATGSQLWDQTVDGVQGSGNGQFGRALASGDFNGDGAADLAIGVPYYSPGALLTITGAVNVLYGSTEGLTAANDDLWTSADLPGSQESLEYLGRSLASADFDGDGYADLAMGMPGDLVAGLEHAGSVQVLYGGPDGLRGDSAQRLLRGMSSSNQAHAWFGSQLAAGDFDGDGLADLVVRSNAARHGGDLSAFYGDVTGLGESPTSLAVIGEGELAVGDFDGDGIDDLVVGAPHGVRGGEVFVLPGSASGLHDADAQVWSQLTAGVPGAAEAGDRFGEAVAAGDVDGDGIDDLAVGVPREDSATILNVGTVVVLFGSPDGLTAVDAQLWSQGKPGVPGRREAWDRFGGSLASGDYDGSGEAELAIGVPGEGPAELGDVGLVDVLYGGAAGLSSAGAQAWSKRTDGIAGDPATCEMFGFALTP